MKCMPRIPLQYDMSFHNSPSWIFYCDFESFFMAETFEKWPPSTISYTVTVPKNHLEQFSSLVFKHPTCLLVEFCRWCSIWFSRSNSLSSPMVKTCASVVMLISNRNSNGIVLFPSDATVETIFFTVPTWLFYLSASNLALTSQNSPTNLSPYSSIRPSKIIWL